MRAAIFLLGAMLALPVAAEKEPASAVLKLQQADGSTRRYKAYPAETARLLFPSGTALVPANPATPSGELHLSFAQGRARIVRVADAAHRFEITGVILGDAVFLFSELFCDANAGVMNRLLVASGTRPGSQEDALDLARDYVSLSAYGGEDSGKFIISGADEIAGPSRPPTGSRDPIRDVLHAPRAKREGNAYRIDLFTNGPDRKSVHQWQMTIDSQGLSDATDRVIFPEFDFRKRLIEEAERRPAESGRREIEFWPLLMGNGVTDDGGQTDLQHWAASEGPGVEKDHVYYTSSERAEDRFQRYLKRAVAVVKRSTWTESPGRSKNPEVLLIAASDDGKYLYGEKIFKDSLSVLVYTCTCVDTLRFSDH